jgi:hypothetical protein
MNAHTRTIRRRLRRRQNIKEALQYTTLIAATVGVFWFCIVVWFPHVDCATARDGLSFIEQCETDANCTLRPNELRQRETLTRLALKSCPASPAKD